MCLQQAARGSSSTFSQLLPLWIMTHDPSRWTRYQTLILVLGLLAMIPLLLFLRSLPLQ
jgi:hypothetical protein